MTLSFPYFLLGFLLAGFVLYWLANQCLGRATEHWGWELASILLWPLSILLALITMRPAKQEGCILDALTNSSKDGLSGAELAAATGIATGGLYVILASMEKRGRIVSAWVDGPYPRRRLYRLSR